MKWIAVFLMLVVAVGCGNSNDSDNDENSAHESTSTWSNGNLHVEYPDFSTVEYRSREIDISGSMYSESIYILHNIVEINFPVKNISDGWMSESEIASQLGLGDEDCSLTWSAYDNGYTISLEPLAPYRKSFDHYTYYIYDTNKDGMLASGTTANVEIELYFDQQDLISGTGIQDADRAVLRLPFYEKVLNQNELRAIVLQTEELKAVGGRKDDVDGETEQNYENSSSRNMTDLGVYEDDMEAQARLDEMMSKYPGDYSVLSFNEVTDEYLEGRSNSELRLMRNEIFARHGYIFKSKDLREHFSVQPWYEPRFDNVTDKLSEIEKANIALIKRYEK